MALSQIHRNSVKHWRSKREDKFLSSLFSWFTLNHTRFIDGSVYVRFEKCQDRIYPKYTRKHRCKYMILNV